MSRANAVCVAWWRDQSGATAIEYAMVATAVSICIIAALRAIGGTLNTNYYSRVSSGLS